jgi:hypothetical protein
MVVGGQIIADFDFQRWRMDGPMSLCSFCNDLIGDLMLEKQRKFLF